MRQNRWRREIRRQRKKERERKEIVRLRKKGRGDIKPVLRSLKASYTKMLNESPNVKEM